MAAFRAMDSRAVPSPYALHTRYAAGANHARTPSERASADYELEWADSGADSTEALLRNP